MVSKALTATSEGYKKLRPKPAAEYRVFGPPGTGKTTWVIRQLKNALRSHSPNEIYVCSFTRTAAVEIVNRVAAEMDHLPGEAIPAANIGTIHALCYRLLGKPSITEAHYSRDWNERYGKYWPVGATAKNSIDEPYLDDMGGSTAIQLYNRERAMQTGRKVQEQFAKYWEEFKAETGSMDFTDLLLNAPASLPDCKVLFVDEAQDLTPLQWEIVRMWGSTAETFVVCGDDDQLLFEFTGAKVENFLSPIPEDCIKTLSKSYRLPAAIHACAEKFIHRLGTRRQEKQYSPRGEGGIVERKPFMFADPAPLVRDLLSRDESVMILASCAYMLKPIITQLRLNGIPFHNPYRKNRGDWNPLAKGSPKLSAFIQLSAAFASGDEKTITSAPLWVALGSVLKADGVFHRGAKARLAAHETEYLSLADASAMFIDSSPMHAIASRDLEWLQAHVTGSTRSALEYPLKVLENGGDLGAVPRIVVGTIHSVKGGEADAVYLSPDLSIAAYRELVTTGVSARDATIRMFYVGMTRARERLVLCDPSSRYSVEV